MPGSDPDRTGTPVVGAGPTRPGEARAPAWLIGIVRPARVPAPWGDMIRVALAVSVPLAVAAGLGVPRLGVYGSIGAVGASIADRGGPPRQRVTRGAVAAAFSAAGFVAGDILRSGGWTSLLVICLLAALSGLLSNVNAALSVGGLQLLVVASLASGLPVAGSVALGTGLLLAGAAWAVLLTWVHAVARGYRSVEREAVAAVFDRIADLLATTARPDAERARRLLTGALNRAYDVVLDTRSRSAGRSRDLQRLGAVLNGATALVEASVAAAAAADPPPERAVTAVRDLAVQVRTGRAPRDPPPAPATDDPLFRAVALGWRTAADRAAGLAGERAPAAPQRRHRPLGERLTATADRLTGPRTWAYVARLTLCMGIAERIRYVLPIQRPYWVMLTVAIVLKPDLGSVFARAVQRAFGTLFGVLIGAVLLAAVPRGPWLLLPVAVTAALVPWGQRVNYGLLAVFVTPLVIVLVDVAGAGGPGLAATRLLDTLIGCLIVLVFGYLLWPQTWRLRLGETVAGSVDALAGYLEVALTGDHIRAGRRRRHAYRMLSDLRTEFQRSLAEPPPVSTRAAAWWPLILQLERTADEITAARTVVRHQHTADRRAEDHRAEDHRAADHRAADQGAADQGAADQGMARRLARALRELGHRLRTGTVPDPVHAATGPGTRQPPDGPLADVAAEIHTACRLAGDPLRAEAARFAPLAVRRRLLPARTRSRLHRRHQERLHRRHG